MFLFAKTSGAVFICSLNLQLKQHLAQGITHNAVLIQLMKACVYLHDEEHGLISKRPPQRPLVAFAIIDKTPGG